MLATVLGINFDTNRSYNERLGHWKLSGEIVKTRNITQAGIGRKGLWTTVIAAAVFVPPGEGKK
jgi:arginine decarboxylase